MPALVPLGFMLWLAASSCGAQASYSIKAGLPAAYSGSGSEMAMAIVDQAAAGLGLRRTEGEAATILIAMSAKLGKPEEAEGGGSVVVMRRFLAPVSRAQECRWDATLADCLSGAQTLAAIDAIPEGFVAMTVDGKAADDAAYPLVETVTASVAGGSSDSLVSRLSARIKAAATVAEAPDIVWIASAGDMMLGRGAAKKLAEGGAAGLMGGAAAILAGADIAIVNLEGAVTSRGAKASKSYTFRFDPSVVPNLKKAGIDAALVSNNHALDWGTVGLIDTLDALGAAGIGALGAGRNGSEASSPFAAAGARLYGISSYPREGTGWDGADYAAAEGKPGIMRSEKGGADRLAASFGPDAIDVVVFHGGSEWSTKPDIATRALYRSLVDKGADVVFGSHPHVAQGFELYKGVPIFWSLGNFVFQGMQDTAGGEDGLVAVVGMLGERAVYIRAYPVTLREETVGLSASKALLDRFIARSRALMRE